MIDKDLLVTAEYAVHSVGRNCTGQTGVCECQMCKDFDVMAQDGRLQEMVLFYDNTPMPINAQHRYGTSMNLISIAYGFQLGRAYRDLEISNEKIGEITQK